MPLFIETYRGTVGPTDCDDLGHMNVQHYFAAVSNGMFAMMSRLGLTPEEIQRRQMSFAVVHAETDFHRELHSTGTSALPPKADMCGALARRKLAYAVSSKCFGLITSLLKFSEKVSEPRGH